MKCLPALVAALLAACSGGSMDAPAPSAIHVGTALAADQSMARGLNAMPRTLDPTLLTDQDGQSVVDDLFEGLTAIGPNDDIVPGVARSWEASADGKTWIFHLRPTARWSNGDPVTAADFVYAWRREVDPKTAAEYAAASARWVTVTAIATGRQPLGASGLTAIDEHTLRVALVSPTPYLLAVVAAQLLPAGAARDHRALWRQLDPPQAHGLQRPLRA